MRAAPPDCRPYTRRAALVYTRMALLPQRPIAVIRPAPSHALRHSRVGGNPAYVRRRRPGSQGSR